LSGTRTALLAGAVLVGGLLFFVAKPVDAVESSSGVGAVPAHPSDDNPRTKSIFVYEAKPSSVTNDAIKIINNTTEQRTIKVYAVDSQNSSDGAFACAQAADQKTAVGSWLVLAQNEVTLAPKQNQEIPFTVTVPANASTGEYNGCIAVEDVNGPTQSAGNGIVLSFRSAIRVALTVPGKIDADLTYTDLLINEKTDKLIVSPILKNTGNVSVDASVRTSLKSLFGNTIDESEGTFAVLNKALSRFNFDINRPFWGGWYILENETDYSILSQHPPKVVTHETTRSDPRTIFIAPSPAAALVYATVTVTVIGGMSTLVLRRRQLKLMHQTTRAYKVKAGDNIQNLAQEAGINWRTLAKLNKLKSPYSLDIGQTLRVPKPRLTSSSKSSKKQP
jgi:hypothetical protein